MATSPPPLEQDRPAKPKPKPTFPLTSPQTLLAALVPPHHQSRIDALRAAHDRAHLKSPALIPICHPFVALPHLPAAIAAITQCIADVPLARVPVSVAAVGTEEHGRGRGRTATVFLELDAGAAAGLVALRRAIVSALGGSGDDADAEGAAYCPRVTVGQACATDGGVEEVEQKAAGLVGIEWECGSLAVLRRDSSGTMRIVDEIALERGSAAAGERKGVHAGRAAEMRNWSAVYAAVVVPEIEQLPTLGGNMETPSTGKETLSRTKKTASDVKETAPEDKGSENSASEEKQKVRLRPAHDIIHRIKWDPELDADDYIIGYTERFEGTAELALRLWKTEQTDEEFIPLHRIIYIRRRGESGPRVWDRNTRFDAIFGSGIKKAGVERDGVRR